MHLHVLFLTESIHLKLKDKLAAYDCGQMPVGYLVQKFDHG